MAQLTRSSLALLLRSQRGCVPATLVARTPQRLLKKRRGSHEPCPFAAVDKIARVNGLLGVRYAHAVTRQRLREGRPRGADGEVLPFHALPRSWGAREFCGARPTPLVAHGDQLYLTLKKQNVLAERYETPQGQPVDAAALVGYLPVRNAPHRQGVRRTVAVRDYRLDHVLAITIAGVEYAVAQPRRPAKRRPAKRRPAKRA